MRWFGHVLVPLLLTTLAAGSVAQVIEFESGGLKYQTLTEDGVTVMFAVLPTTIREFSILQVAVSNGSGKTATIRPTDFVIETPGGGEVHGVPAVSVIRQLIQDASGQDVIKMVTAYEMGLYGFGTGRLTNGYERRRQSALAVVSSKRLKAAAAASAIAFVETELRPGETTDGALFYPNFGRTPTQITLRVYVEGKTFQFVPTTPPPEQR